jgi:hypothetical protein
MSTISHDPAEVGRSERGWRVQLLVPEMWASLAIAVMWLAVLFTSIYGPAIATVGVAGDSSQVPSGIVVAFFAFLGTWVVAWFGFRRARKT